MTVEDASKRRQARIKDVAALAGVSLKTVTNVVHDRPCVADATRARVKAAIVELDYSPSLTARQLQSGRSKLVALAVPRINEPYLGALAHALIAAARQRSYKLLINETGGQRENETLAASGYPGHGIDGVIFEALDAHHLVGMSRTTPMVLLGERLPDSTADHVAIDNTRSARDVVAHLIDGGRRKIAFLGHQPGSATGVPFLRYRGFVQEMEAAGIEVRHDWVIEAPQFTREEGEARTRAALPRVVGVDALVCASDLLAIGAMRALHRRHRQVPDDVAVVGWDNTVDGVYHTPSLSSVAPDLSRLADQTIDALVGRIEGNRSASMSYVVPHQLVVRDSSTVLERH